MLFNEWSLDRVRVIWQSPVNSEGYSHEKPGGLQSLSEAAGYGSRAAVDAKHTLINLHVLNYMNATLKTHRKRIRDRRNAFVIWKL